MNCPVCGKGKLARKKVMVEKFGESIGIFTAEVCASCGEQIFDAREAEKIEAKIKAVGLWGAPQPARLYKIGSSLVISIKKKVADALKITKDSSAVLIPEVKNRRLIVDFS